MLIIDNQTDSDLSEDIFHAMLDLVCREEGCADKDVNLILSSDGSIRELNRKYLGKDALTDVISFSSSNEFTPSLGDIIIDTRVAEQQKSNHSLLEEVAYLFLHGILHLLGYDHLAAASRLQMETKQEYYWLKCKELIR
ncbi:MAG: rRNA maturation RNase YbeY [Candidatus Cloacimonetes bacterium]|nr:rRNA maturation RNase YbeY [Candidatus Cloacimonadota bacterium]